jgi:hypothetical protein
LNANIIFEGKKLAIISSCIVYCHPFLAKRGFFFIDSIYIVKRIQYGQESWILFLIKKRVYWPTFVGCYEGVFEGCCVDLYHKDVVGFKVQNMKQNHGCKT